ncbi:MAG: DUF4829 domain-containing protein [Coriobacteriales bacterium]|nr:DUF4829 domain-containing protein [Coriobacteriales bacterium]
MKKILVGTIMLVAYCLFSACNFNIENTDQDDTEAAYEEKFSAKEIEAAKACVRWEFEEGDFSEGFTLISLYYDDIDSGKEAERYQTDSINQHDIVVLFSVFETDSSHVGGINSSFSPNSEYHWKWILVRASSSGGWEIRDWGI